MTGTPTRNSLHGIAEHLLAGPQYRASGTIRLRPSDGGFGTVADPDVRVDGLELVVAGERFALPGTTLAGLAEAAGLDGGPPEGLYADHAAIGPDTSLDIDAAGVAALAEAFAVGDDALRALVPGATPVIWPEHFDIAVTVGDRTFGVSPGDDYLAQPYAYVSRFPVPDGEFWNAPFGAARPLAGLVGAEQVTAFFAEGRD